MSWKRSDQLVGRTRSDHIVVFPGGKELIGRTERVRITAATALTLHGTPAVSAQASEFAALPSKNDVPRRDFAPQPHTRAARELRVL